jgi:pimeloyl-ACP methyl ester carboxylesterase
MTAVRTSDGFALYAESDGSGLPILFIHEFAADHRTWATQVSGLRDEFQCITYSARGYPPSDVPPEQQSYSYIRAADDAIDVLDAFGIEKAHIVGLSMGGFCALQLGIRYRDRVSSLLVSSAGSGASPANREAFIIETETIAKAFRRDGSLAVAKKLAVGPSRIQLQRKNAAAWDKFVTQLGEHSAEGMALTVIGVQQSRPSLWDIADELRQVTTPTLTVNGDEDEAVLEAGLMLKRTMPAVGLLVVPNAGHALNLEEPDIYNWILRTFIHTVERGEWPARDPRSLSPATGIGDGGAGVPDD